MDFQEQLANQKIDVLKSVSCRELCTFKVGGIADFVVRPKNIEELKITLTTARECDIKTQIIGRGSNILFSDLGFKGAVVQMGKAFGRITKTGDMNIRANAGADLITLCCFAAENFLSGLEFAFGIPGTVGGATYMNAGAYGGEICNTIETVCVLDKDNNTIIKTKEDMDFSYRNSALQQSGEVVLYVDFKLVLGNGNSDEIFLKMQEYSKRRRQKQPLSLPSAGSTFKRPKDGYASEIIERCGLKGLSVGGAAVSEKHAGFIVNTGTATADDIINLIDKVNETVFLKTGNRLELEVKIV